MEARERFGRPLALQALRGEATKSIPVALFTWGFDYTWKVAGIEPWRLACGDTETWRGAYRALVGRHQPDLVFYEGMGSGDSPPSLLDEDGDQWVVLDGNTGVRYGLNKHSLALFSLDTRRKTCDPLDPIQCRRDADRLIAEFTTWGQTYLDGLRWFVEEAGDRALVLPHHSPAYICACYAFGFERAMDLMLTDPALFHYVCQRHQAGEALRMKEWKAAGAEAVFIADSWASCDVVSREMVREFALPYQRSITEAAHAAGLKIILWNEGNVLPILADEAGIPVDAFAFEQSRKGISQTVADVRAVFGPSRCLWGNLDSEHLLLRGTSAEIEDAVRSQIAESGPSSPFILSTGSPLPSNVEPEAVDIMIASARNFERGITE